MRNGHAVIASNTCWYAYNFRRSLITALLQAGWKVTVLAPRDPYTERLLGLGASHRHIDVKPKGTNPFLELAAVVKYRKAYRELRPAISLQHTIKPVIYGSIAARSGGVPVVNTITGLGTMFSGGFKEVLIRVLYRYALSHAELTIFQNEDDRALFVRHGIVPENRTALIPGSGVDTERFAPQPRGSGPFTFLLAARLLRSKGVEVFIEAARQVRFRHPASRFVLVGSHDPSDGEYVDEGLVTKAHADGVVERHDHVDDIRPLLASADCVVLPSFYREGVPRSLLEGASMGKPLIAADSVGTREPVRDGGNGFLCRPRDPADLAAKMETMLSLPPARLAEMGEASRAYMLERFDERLVVSVYMQSIHGLAREARTEN